MFGTVFLTLGITLYTMSDTIFDLRIQYDIVCGETVRLPFENNVNPNVCMIELDIEQPIEGPVYVYYQLENFYQNHRNYVISRSNEQLLGKELDVAQLSHDCNPIITNGDLGFTKSVNNSTLDENAAAFPCGLVAQSFFNDTYTFYSEIVDESDLQKNRIEIDDSDIAWESDVKNKFFNMESEWETNQWIDVSDRKQNHV